MARRDIWDEMKRMHDNMEKMFGDFLSEPENLLEGREGANTPQNYRRPASDLWEDDKNVVAEIDMPGLDKKDIKISVNDDGLDIKAEKGDEKKQEDKKKGVYKYERSHAGFYRHFPLPNDADPNKAEAEYKNGVLKVTVPKKKISNKKTRYLDIK